MRLASVSLSRWPNHSERTQVIPRNCTLWNKVASERSTPRFRVPASVECRNTTGDRDAFARERVSHAEPYVARAVTGDRSTSGVEGFTGETVGREQPPHHGGERRLSIGQASTDSAGCMVIR